ncbi:hypothetical protein ABZ639_05410 [Saccharomonospora sp. NPDC006951]
MTTPATATRAFFAFPHISDPARHRDYNAWHQLDHQPENLALPGVLRGDRWVRTPECAAAGSAPGPVLAGTHYLAMYWFAEPAEDSIRQWRDLGETTLQQGRRPDLHYTSRPLMGMFRPVKGYVNPEARVSAAALPYRPHNGVYVSVTEVAEPRGPAAADLFAWYDKEKIPWALRLPGAAGCWTFRGENVGGTAPNLPEASALRITVYYLDGDPLAFASLMRRAGPPSPLASAERTLLTGPLLSITAGKWDWFDGQDGPALARAVAR